MIATLRAQDPALLEPMGAYGLTLAGVISAAGSVAIGLAFLGSPQLLTRFMAARDQKQIVDGGFWAVICVIGFDVGAVFGGMAGRSLFPGLADPETILPAMSAALFPAFFTGIFLVVVLAAIMSTMDSLLILASSVVVRDIVQKTLGSSASERMLSIMGKGITVVIGIVGLVVALLEVRVIFDFVLFAWSGIACAFTPVVLCSLYWKRTTREGAIAGMIGGFVTTVIWVRVFKAGFYELYEMIPGFAAGLLVCIVVSLATKPDERAVAELESVRGTVGPVF